MQGGDRFPEEEQRWSIRMGNLHWFKGSIVGQRMLKLMRNLILTVSVVEKHIKCDTPRDPAIETKSLSPFDFFSRNFIAVKGSIIFRVS